MRIFQLISALIKRRPQRRAIKPCESAAAKRRDQAEQRKVSLEGCSHRHCDWLVRAYEQPGKTYGRISPNHPRLASGHSKRTEAQNNKDYAGEIEPDFGCKINCGELYRDRADALRNRKVVIFELVVDVAF